MVFIGSHDWRADAIRTIARKHGLRILVKCTTGPREKSETAALYARAKVVFNRHVANDLNFRVFEAMACGRVLLTDAQPNGQYELFRDGQHLVLYTDDRDLEERLLRYLADETARGEIERAAAHEIAERHSTRARVEQLVAAIERELTTRPAATPVVPRSEPTGPWLFLLEDAPDTVERRTYGERRARTLARRGETVVVARRSRRAFANEVPCEIEPGLVLVELDAGVCPEARGDSTSRLVGTAALHAEVERVLRERGPFKTIVAEGGFGALVAAPAATRHGLDYVQILETCEAGRRSNRLTREQLYVAELEHWGVRQACAVWVPDQATESQVARFYPDARPLLRVEAPPTAEVSVPRGARRLLERLGLEPAGYDVVLDARTHSLTEVPTVSVRRDGTWIERTRSRVQLSRRPASGGVLAALLAFARQVIAERDDDTRLVEAALLARSITASAARS